MRAKLREEEMNQEAKQALKNVILLAESLNASIQEANQHNDIQDNDNLQDSLAMLACGIDEVSQYKGEL